MHEAKQGCGVVYCKTLLLVSGVRADPKYSYSYGIICMHVRIVAFDFSLKCYISFFRQYLVVGSRYVSFSVSITCGATHAGRILFDTKRKRENSRVWPFEVRVMLLLDRSRA